MVDKLPKSKKTSSLAVPFSLSIFKKCVEYNIDFSLVKHLHFYDLQCLIIQFDINKVKDYLRQEEQKDLNKRGISSVKDISGNDALKFLGR